MATEDEVYLVNYLSRKVRELENKVQKLLPYREHCRKQMEALEETAMEYSQLCDLFGQENGEQ